MLSDPPLSYFEHLKVTHTINKIHFDEIQRKRCTNIKEILGSLFLSVWFIGAGACSKKIVKGNDDVTEGKLRGVL